MQLTKYHLYILLVLLMICQACAVSDSAQPQQTAMQHHTAPYEAQAVQHENNDEIQKAILQLQVAKQIITNDIDRLKKKAIDLSEEKYRQGLAFESKGDIENAKKSFLASIRYNASHAGALSKLKQKHKPAAMHQEYTIQKGDSLSHISRQFYQTATYYKIIATYNNMPVSRPLIPGQKLKIPQLDTVSAKTLFNRRHTLSMAEKALKSSHFQRAIGHAQTILKYKHADPDALRIINQAYLEMGEKAAAQGKNEDALALFYQVAPGFNNVETKIDSLNKRMRLETEEAHQLKNASLYKRAKRLSADNRLREALGTFQKTDPDYKDTKNQISALSKKITVLTESHYNKGITYFVREDLDNAITEWEIVLSLNPNHPKALKDIEIAKSLKQKIKQHP